MIVAETANGYRFVTQEAHADLAGQFAQRWGADPFEPPRPRGPLLAAAFEHDAGWHRYDRRPHLHDGGCRDGPVDFRGMPLETWVDLYETGIDLVADLDPYAGLLVSLHGAGLRNKRYGLSPGWPDPPEGAEEFLARQHERQRRLASALVDRADYPVGAAERDLLESLQASRTVPAGYDGRLWHDYTLLQAWDTLSLAFCTTTEPPSYDPIGAVPTAPDRPDTALSVDPQGSGVYAVDPYPFTESPLSVSVPARTVDREAVEAGNDGLTRAYYAADRERIRLELRPP